MTTRRFGIPLSAAALALVGWAGWGGQLSRTEGRAPPVEDAVSSGYVGSLSCAAAGCHNGNGADPGGSEYGIWSSRDPHARSFSVLTEQRSCDMLRRWRPTADNPTKEPACLACHAPLSGQGDLAADGVSCESCHGPAAKWRDRHYTADWHGLPSAEKERLGFQPTKNLAFRIGLCADCHVGRPGAEVGHDLIAAGHPRLTFEYTAYHELLPRHWLEKTYGKGFAARAWELGQVVVAGKAAALLEARALGADRAATLPAEFADYDCYACHHDLRQPSWRQQGGARPGLPAWGTWTLALVPTLAKQGGLDPAVAVPADAADGLLRTMSRPHPACGEVADAAKAASAGLGKWAAALQDAADPAVGHARTLDKERVRAQLLHLAAADDPADWDQAAQTYLAIAALYQSIAAIDPDYPTSDRRVAVERLRDAVAFPGRSADGPVDFTPARFRAALKSIQSAFGDRPVPEPASRRKGEP